MPAVTPAPTHDHGYIRGCAQVLFAGCVLSVGGLIVRNIDAAGDWQIVCYRSLAVAVSLLVLMALRDRTAVLRTFRNSGLASIVAAGSMATAMATFILAINHTTVANALFLLAAAPFFAALLGRAVLGERTTTATWIAMAVAAGGIAVMVWQGVSVGGLFGNLMGLLTALGFAAFSVALRAGRAVDMMPAICVAGVISAALAAAVVYGSGASLAISVHDLVLCLGYGAVITLGLAIYTLGSRALPAAELTLLSLTEVLLGPVWVWLGVGEVPHRLTIIGGAILTGAIVGHAAVSIHRRRPQSHPLRL